MIKEGDAKAISVSQALDALRRSHEAGLVHMAFTERRNKQPFIICSCCSCCCQSLSALVRFNTPNAVDASEHIALQDIKKCSNCGICVQRCQFHARQLVNRELVFIDEKCFGYGLCVSTCPNDAISLEKRS